MGSRLDINALYGLQNFRYDLASPVTAASVLASMSNGARYVIDTFVISSKVAGDAILSEQNVSGSAAIGPQMWFGAQGGAALDDAYIKLSRNAGLTITTTGTGSMSIFGLYHLES